MKIRKLLMVILCLIMFVPNAQGKTAGDKTNMDDLVTLHRVIEHLRKTGARNTYAEIKDPRSIFANPNIVIVVHDSNGACLARSQKPKVCDNSKSYMSMKDGDSKLFIKERIELAKKNANSYFTQTIRRVDPKTNTSTTGIFQCRKYEETVVCVSDKRKNVVQ